MKRRRNKTVAFLCERVMNINSNINALAKWKNQSKKKTRKKNEFGTQMSKLHFELLPVPKSLIIQIASGNFLCIVTMFHVYVAHLIRLRP